MKPNEYINPAIPKPQTHVVEPSRRVSPPPPPQKNK